ncbi:MAG: NAD-dependent epimerase/dehydratase family protein [Bacillota bacterium]|nr:NAD-dependent epimerase/dehydratase family protein [Bacillota bacterium]
MKKVLVLGGTYFIGKYIAENLVKDNFDVVVLNRGTKAGIFGDAVKEIHCDREDAEDIKQKLYGMIFDYVIDVSALNVLHVRNSYEALKNSYIKRYIFISSSAVYVPSNEIPISEDSEKGENHYWGDYGIDKLQAENFLLEKNKTGRFPVQILRPPYVYGEGNYVYREGFVFDRIINNKKVILPNSGRTIVQFIHVEDLYNTIMALLKTENGIGEAFNVGNTHGITFRGWIEACSKACNKPVDITEFYYKHTDYGCRDFFPFHDYQYMLDTRKIEKYYTPKISMIEGLKRAYDWYTQNKDLVNKKPHYAENEEKIYGLLNY